MKKLRIGIIGCGEILAVHLAAINVLETSDLVMVCDLKAGVAKTVAQKQACEWTTDYKVLLNRGDIDVVHILLPHYLHVPVALDALKAGKHIVLEKPVGISMEQLKALEEAAENNDCSVGVTFQNRFNPTTLKAKEVIASGQLGGFLGAKGSVTWCRKDGYYNNSDWHGILAYEGGGLLINQAIHTLDLLEHIGGEVTSLRATAVNATHPEIEVEDTVMATLNYRDGMVGHFFGTNSYGENSAIEMAFLYEEGKLVFRDQRLYLVTETKEELLTHDIVKKGEKAYWGKSHQLIIEDIYTSILEGYEPKVTLKDAIRTTELALGGYESSRTGTVYKMLR